MINPEPGLRRFALTVYQREGVSSASLLLQDRCAVDVNVLLLAAYVGGARRGVFGRSDVTEAHRRVGQWQRDVIGPLRLLRQRLKDGPPPAPAPATEELRDRVKALELDAELLELDQLALFADELDSLAPAGSGHELATAAMNVVIRYSAKREPDDEEFCAIAVIAAAAAQYDERS